MNPGASQRHEKLLTGRSVILKCQESPYQVKVYHHLYISTLSRQSFAQKHPGLVIISNCFDVGQSKGKPDWDGVFITKSGNSQLTTNHSQIITKPEKEVRSPATAVGD